MSFASISADLNTDGLVDISDYSILVSQFLQEGPNLTANLNGDTIVDVPDYSLLVQEFLKSIGKQLSLSSF